MIDTRITFHRIWPACTLALLVLSVSLGAEAAEDSPAPSPDAEQPAVEDSTPPLPTRQPPGAAARAIIDPETGELTTRGVEVEWREPSPGLRERLSRRSDDLHEEPLPGGGIMVDLRGRFQTLLVATVGADGELRTRCVGSAPGEAGPAFEADSGSPAPAARLDDPVEPDAGQDSGAGGEDG